MALFPGLYKVSFETHSSAEAGRLIAQLSIVGNTGEAAGSVFGIDARL